MKGEICMKRSEKAVELFESGYNCAQSVFGAFAEDIGVQPDIALKMSAPFGGGIGRLREVCGACSGMLMVLGTVEGYSTPETGDTKARHYALVRELCSRFKDENGSLLCREILKTDEVGGTPEARTDKYYKERPCVRCVRTAAEIIEQHLNDSKNK